VDVSLASAIYALAQTLRVGTVTPLVRFEGLPGKFSQHAFGEAWVRRFLNSGRTWVAAGSGQCAGFASHRRPSSTPPMALKCVS